MTVKNPTKPPLSYRMNKQVFGFIDSLCNTLDDDTSLTTKQLRSAWEAYCKAKGLTVHEMLLTRTITALDLPYFKRVGNGEHTRYVYTAANNRIIQCRSLSSEQEQRIHDLATMYHFAGILPFLIRPDRAYREATLFGYEAVMPLMTTEYKGYLLDHLTLDIDNDLVLVCMNKQNNRVLRFRVGY